MSEDDITLVQLIRGSDGGAARRHGLNTAQIAGEACLVCCGTDDLNVDVGWVDGVAVKVHSYHVEKWRMGETTH